VWGGILTTHALHRRLGGTVIHGAARDFALIRETGYPVFARGVTMRTGKDRVQVDGLGLPVSLGTTSVHPGDLIIGDADGVVVVPQGVESDVLEASCAIARAEESILHAIAQGTRLDAARQGARYHELQRERRG
ncbi:MAG: RraA family protein, partial [Vicinamibacterales bacterium]